MTKKIKKTLMILALILILIPVGRFSLPYIIQFRYSWLAYRRGVDASHLLTVSQISTKGESPVEYGVPARGIDAANIQSAGEYLKLAPPKTDSEVLRIAQDPGQKHLLAAYEDGKLRQWNIPSKSLVAEYDFYAEDPLYFFSEDGAMLASSGGTIWSTSDGRLVFCSEERTCPEGSSAANADPYSLENSSAYYLDPLGRYLVGYYMGMYGESDFSLNGDRDSRFTDNLGSPFAGLSCWDFVSDRRFFRDFDGDLDFRDNAATVERIAIDPSGHYAACFLSSGVIIVRDWTTAFEGLVQPEYSGIHNKEYPYVYFIRYEMPQGGSIKDMAFDATRTWLSVMTDKEMVVWDLRSQSLDSHLDVSLNDGNVIAFDRAGKLLALGTKHGITIYDVEQAKQIAEFEVGEVTALYFTRDNRLLVWGDAKGNLHLWGVPQK